MICAKEGCNKEAVTFHGITRTTHGYCEEHRCCKKCGRMINYGCHCEEPKERGEYLKYKEK